MHSCGLDSSLSLRVLQNFDSFFWAEPAGEADGEGAPPVPLYGDVMVMDGHQRLVFEEKEEL